MKRVIQPLGLTGILLSLVVSAPSTPMSRADQTKSKAQTAVAHLPKGRGLKQVQNACLFCHDEDIIVQQRLDRARWERVVDKMIRWGAPLEEKDRQRVIDYLAKNFPEELTTTIRKK